MSYEIVFDVGRQGPQYWWLLAIPVTMSVAGIAMLRTPLSKGNRAFLVIWTGGAMMVGLFFGASMAKEYVDLRAALASGRYRVVEGTVTGFDSASGGDHHPEHFTVITATGPVDYTYSWASVTQGFNQSRPHGGPMRDGLHVRIADVNGTIARLEIAQP